MNTKELQSRHLNVTPYGTYIVPSNEKPGIILFYKHGCGYCTEFLPIFEKFAKQARGINIYKIEETHISAQIDKSLGLEGYPSIFLFDKKGRIFSYYTGPRTVKDMNNYICKELNICY